MKKSSLVFIGFSILLILPNLLYSQSLKDTKDYIIEKIQSYPAGDSFLNDVLFDFNADKSQIDDFKGYTLSAEEFQYLFTYVSTTYKDANKVHAAYSTGCIFDIRSINKISLSKNGSTNAGDSYILRLYLNPKYKAVKYTQSQYSTGGERTNIYQVDIYLSYNLEAANKIKKAIIHLGELCGISIKDGDLF